MFLIIEVFLESFKPLPFQNDHIYNIHFYVTYTQWGATVNIIGWVKAGRNGQKKDCPELVDEKI